MINAKINSLFIKWGKKNAIGFYTVMVMCVGLCMWFCDGEKRRESAAWYVLGFLFGLFAYIITLFIKPKEPEFDDIEIQRTIAEDKVQVMKRDISTGKVWVCQQCHRVNGRYMTTCSCGTQKPIRERL